MKKLLFSLCVTALTALLFPGSSLAIDLEGLSYEQMLEESSAIELTDRRHVWESEQGSLDRSTQLSWQSQDKGPKTFIDGNGDVYRTDALKIIDVSSWQGEIDWDAVAKTNVDGVILRIGYGWGNEDSQFKRNIQECRRLGIPFGVYLYSYAYDAEFAKNEALWIDAVFSEYDIPLDTLVFYDLEAWTPWEGHTCPSTPGAYDPIVQAFFEMLDERGFTNSHIYTYRAYLQSALNADNFHEKAAWVAEYNPTLKWTFKNGTEVQGWQYTSQESVSGIEGNVDVSAFSPMSGWYSLAGFSDVFVDTPHSSDIVWLAEEGISEGYEDGTFRPMEAVYRQDMAAFLYRLAGSPDYEPSVEDMQRFPDVTTSTPHANEIWWLASSGISTGYQDGTFRPMEMVYRQDMAAFLHRLFGNVLFVPTEDLELIFSDVTSETPHANSILWLTSEGIAKGYDDGTYRGMAPTYRQDMAAFLHRFATIGREFEEAVPSKIRERWNQEFSAGNDLGAAVYRPQYLSGAVFVEFQNGVIFSENTPSGKSYIVADPILEGLREGKLSYVGKPVSEVQEVDSGKRQDFEKGTLFYSANSGVQFVCGGIRDAYEAMGSTSSVIGFPKSWELPAANGGVFQRFENGTFYWSAQTGAHAVYGDIRSRYAQSGYEYGIHGYPVSDVYSDRGTKRQDFQHGSLWEGGVPAGTYYHNVQWAGQPNNYYCGPTSGYMILSTLGAWSSSSGTPLSIWNVAGYMDTDFYGYTSFRDRKFENGMNSWLGRKVYTTTAAPNYDAVRDGIIRSYETGYPTVVDTQERRGGPHLNGHNNATFTHIMVVDAYDTSADKVMLADPGAETLWSGASRKFWYSGTLRTFVQNHLAWGALVDPTRCGLINSI